jgi:hypothetical protein
MDYFFLVPTEILKLFLSFVDSPKDLFVLLVVCKRFYSILISNEQFWKESCIKFWNKYKKSISIKGKYDLEWTQRVAEKPWLWFAQCFARDKYFKKTQFHLFIGQKKGSNGWAIRVLPEIVYIGNFINCMLQGSATCITKHYRHDGNFNDGKAAGKGKRVYFHKGSSDALVEYRGRWSYGQEGLSKGKITYMPLLKSYPKEFVVKGKWTGGNSLSCQPNGAGHPEFDAAHPIVKKCIDQELCTKRLGKLLAIPI